MLLNVSLVGLVASPRLPVRRAVCVKTPVGKNQVFFSRHLGRPPRFMHPQSQPSQGGWQWLAGQRSRVSLSSGLGQGPGSALTVLLWTCRSCNAWTSRPENHTISGPHRPLASYSALDTGPDHRRCLLGTYCVRSTLYCNQYQSGAHRMSIAKKSIVPPRDKP